jgi:hypothetical protein
LRHQTVDKPYILTDSQFYSLLENNPDAILYRNRLKQKVYIINPEKIKSSLSEIPESLFGHDIVDDPYSSPPRSKKVADLQEFLGIRTNGLFDTVTFDTLLNTYSKALLIHNVKTINILDKLIVSLTQKIGTEYEAGAYLKGLLVVKIAMVTAKAGNTGDLEKLNLLMSKYLPDMARFKLKDRVRVVQKIYQAINSSPTEKSENLKYLIKEEKNKLVTEDKIRILGAYTNLSQTIYTNEADRSAQVFLIKSLIEDELTFEQKLKISKNFDLFIKQLKHDGQRELVNEMEMLFAKLKVPAIKQLIG